ncbi:MAG: GNAT family N-acetyltransferase [Burkholderiaceae bacterium]
MKIRLDDLRGPEIGNLLQEHLQAMYSVSPPESVHALDIEQLRKPGTTFWSIWSEGELAGCCALQEINQAHGEIKSMRTVERFQRLGAATKLLTHLIEEGRRRGYRRISLETGSEPYFHPARQLYKSFGFSVCGPFESYVLDPNSVFMTREL